MGMIDAKVFTSLIPPQANSMTEEAFSSWGCGMVWIGLCHCQLHLKKLLSTVSLNEDIVKWIFQNALCFFS